MKRTYTPGQLAKRARRKSLRDAYVAPAEKTDVEKALIKDMRVSAVGDSKLLRRRNKEEKMQDLGRDYMIAKRSPKGKRRDVVRIQQKLAALKKRFKTTRKSVERTLAYA